MIKTICKKVYDTDESELLLKNTYGYYGDPQGYEECLYKTKDGAFFMYVNGGFDSRYPKEDILRISKQKAEEMLASR